MENKKLEIPSSDQIEKWLLSYIAKELNLSENKIDCNVTLTKIGLDSVFIMGMLGDLSTWLGHEVDPMWAYDYPTIKELAFCCHKEIS